MLTESLKWLGEQALFIPGHPLFFTDGYFLVFLTLFLAVFYAFGRKPGSRAAIIFIFSLYFYYKNTGWQVWVILLTGLVTFLAGRFYRKKKNHKANLIWISLALLINLGMLIFFKYSGAMDPFFRLFTQSGWQLSSLVFPVGLSFYTFTNIGYLIDIKRGTIEAERSVLSYLTFATFFPVVQMGPIERYRNMADRLKMVVIPDPAAVREGTLLILNGLVKKLVIGDYLDHHLVRIILSSPERYTGMENLSAILAYSLVLYCDFSGYTDIGRGMARWFGFSPALNFNLPYKARNIGEFWRRWHISLSSWLRDYLFMPIAMKMSRWIKREFLFGIPWLKTEQFIFWIASIITFITCGIWHGTGQNFLIWGLMHGLGLAFQRTWNLETRNFRKSQKPLLRHINKRIGVLMTVLFVTSGWVIFRTATPEEALTVFRQMLFSFRGDLLPAFLGAYRFPLLVMAGGFFWHFLPDRFNLMIREWLMNLPLAVILLLAILLMALVMYFQGLGSSQPIYIQF
jgi:D-alanyl-lipoteichoic acid acyltransferase DltB (MBOAT superfamily)